MIDQNGAKKLFHSHRFDLSSDTRTTHRRICGERKFLLRKIKLRFTGWREKNGFLGAL